MSKGNAVREVELVVGIAGCAELNSVLRERVILSRDQGVMELGVLCWGVWTWTFIQAMGHVNPVTRTMELSQAEGSNV